MKTQWKNLRIFAVATVFGVLVLAGISQPASAQVNINVNIGPAPVCPYGYFNYAPYNCAPFGYYGPDWFHSGMFIGAGPWFAGPVGFRGYFDRGFDPRYGYRGGLPPRGARPDWDRHPGWERNFHGRSYRTEVRHDNGNHYGQYREHGNPHGNDRGHGNSHDNGHGHGH